MGLLTDGSHQDDALIWLEQITGVDSVINKRPSWYDEDDWLVIQHAYGDWWTLDSAGD